MSAWYLEIFAVLFILFLPFLYEYNQSFRFYLKFSIYYVGVMFFSTLCIPLYMLKPMDIANFLYGAALCKTISRVIGLKWIVRGKEHLEIDRAAIIVSNHQSAIDILGMFEIWNIMKKCTVVAKKELFYTGPFGIASWLCGIIYIDRVQPNSAKNSVNKAAEIVKEKDAKLWVFAEGTRRNTGEVHQFKKGAFHMAISSQIPILPVVYTRYYFLNHQERRFDNGKIILTALPSISTIGLTINDIEKLMKQTHDAITKVFHEANTEILEGEGLIKTSSASS